MILNLINCEFIFLPRFNKERDKICKKNKKLEELICEAIELLKLNQIQFLDIKKLVGYQTDYRLKIGKIRILFYKDKNKVGFYKIEHRNSVYKNL